VTTPLWLVGAGGNLPVKTKLASLLPAMAFAIITRMNKAKIRIPKSKLIEFCKRWNVSELALFGSVLSSDFRPESDVDVLVSFDPQAQVTLLDMARMQAELKEIFKRDVDLVSKRGLQRSRNYLRRKRILDSAQVIHVS